MPCGLTSVRTRTAVFVFIRVALGCAGKRECRVLRDRTTYEIRLRVYESF